MAKNLQHLTADNCIPLLILLLCTVVPLSLSLSYIVGSLCALIWLVDSVKNKTFQEQTNHPLIRLIWAWLFIAVLSSLFGLDPLRSVRKLSTVALITLIAPCVVIATRKYGLRKLLCALCMSQAVAALHSVVQSHNPSIPQMFVGTVSESGQLIFSFLLAILFFTSQNRIRSQKIKDCILIIVLSLCLCAIGFSSEIMNAQLLLCALACLALILVYQIRYNRSDSLPIGLSFILSALILNLKRGPWLGVISAIFLLSLNFKRKLLIPITIILLILFTSIAPIRDRILASYEHLTIGGGRLVMWEIGIEMAAKYPMGIGFGNSKVLRQLDSQIPPSHEHFHSNLLNIWVETGIIGLSLFLVWIFFFAKTFYKHQDNFTASTLACALIAWQIAGLAEYNFGDSEVLMLAFITIGFLISTIQTNPSPEQLQ